MTTLTQERLTQIHTNIICLALDISKENYLFPIDEAGDYLNAFRQAVIQIILV